MHSLYERLESKSKPFIFYSMRLNRTVTIIVGKVYLTTHAVLMDNKDALQNIAVKNVNESNYAFFAKNAFVAFEAFLASENTISDKTILDFNSINELKDFNQEFVKLRKFTGTALCLAEELKLLKPFFSKKDFYTICHSRFFRELLIQSEKEPRRKSVFKNVSSSELFKLQFEVLDFEQNCEFATMEESDCVNRLGWENILATSPDANVDFKIINNFSDSVSPQLFNVMRKLNRVELDQIQRVYWGKLSPKAILRLNKYVVDNIAYSKPKYIFGPDNLFSSIQEEFSIPATDDELQKASEILDQCPWTLINRINSSGRSLYSSEALCLKLLLNKYSVIEVASFYSAFIHSHSHIESFAKFALNSEEILEEMPLDWWLILENGGT